MVAQLCQDFNNNYEEVNKHLDKMGYNIGMRLVEDFFAKSGTQRCANFRETAEHISKVCSCSGPWCSLQTLDLNRHQCQKLTAARSASRFF